MRDWPYARYGDCDGRPITYDIFDREPQGSMDEWCRKKKKPRMKWKVQCGQSYDIAEDGFCGRCERRRQHQSSVIGHAGFGPSTVYFYSTDSYWLDSTVRTWTCAVSYDTTLLVWFMVRQPTGMVVSDGAVKYCRALFHFNNQTKKWMVKRPINHNHHTCTGVRSTRVMQRNKDVGTALVPGTCTVWFCGERSEMRWLPMNTVGFVLYFP